MTTQANHLIEAYADWLKDRTVLRHVGDWVEVNTPFLDRHNDRLVVYIRERDGMITITDDGYILDDLAMSGCELKTPRRQELLHTVLNGYGVHLEEGALIVRSDRDEFPAKKHRLVQAMLAVNDLFVLSSAQVQSIFVEDVAAWLDSNDIRYSPSINFTGKSGYSHHFDFVIPKSKAKPERIIKAINRPNRESAQALAFAWMDSRAVRPADSKLVAFLNDVEHKVSPGVTEALEQYGINYSLWTKRNDLAPDLAA